MSAETSIETAHLAQLQRLDGAIEKEFTPVSDRMMWTVISESFIFGAYTTAVVNYGNKATDTLHNVKLAIVCVLPLVGMLIAFLAWHAIVAAHAAVDHLKEARGTFERKFKNELLVELISSKQATHSAGNLPPVVLPWVFIVSWTIFGLISVANIFDYNFSLIGASLLPLAIAILSARRSLKNVRVTPNA